MGTGFGFTKYLLVLSLLGCPKDPGETGQRYDSEAPEDLGPCADDGWGAIEQPESAIHVRAEGSDATGDGSQQAPFATLAAAVDAARGRSSDKRIALGPGSFEAGIELWADAGDGATDSGTTVQGCSSAETILSTSDSDATLISISGATEVSVEGLVGRGGTRGIQVYEGAELTLTSVQFAEASEVALLAHGSSTSLTLDGVAISDTAATGTGLGYGVVVQSGAQAAVQDLTLTGCRTVGFLVHSGEGSGVSASHADITSLTVDGTRKNAEGWLGRGLQVQGNATLALSQGSFSGNHDAGIFVLRSPSVAISDVTVTGTLEGEVPDSGELTGDGIVITQGDASHPPSDYQAVLEDNQISSSARAGIVLDAVTATLSGNVATDAHGATSLYSQGSAVVTGDTVLELKTPLVFNTSELSEL